MLLAHPLAPIPPGGLSLTPYAVGVLVLVVAIVLQLRPTAESYRPLAPAPDGPLPRWAWATRAAGLLVLVLLVTASRFGDAGDPLRLPEVLGMYVLWPALLALSLVAPVWRYVDPWDTVAAGITRLRGRLRDLPVDPWWLVVAAGVWGAFFARYATLGPSRVLGNLLLAYTAVLAVGTAVAGRSWVRSAEVFGALFGWLQRTGVRAAAWLPPRGVESVLGVLIAAALVHRARVNRVYGGGELVARPARDTVIVLVVVATIAALVIAALEALARRADAAGSVIAALVPAVASVAIAELLRRTMVAVQLLPSRLGDPWVQGWTPFGDWGASADVNPGGSLAQQAFAAAVLVVGHGLGAWVVVRRTPTAGQRRAALLALWTLGAVATVVILAQPPQPLSYGG